MKQTSPIKISAGIEAQDPSNLNRTGIFVCNCGGKISSKLDTFSLCQQAGQKPGVVYSIEEDFPCSKDGRQRMIEAIRQHQLDRVMVAGCAPRLVEKLFRDSIQAATEQYEFPPVELEIANIREQCANVHNVKSTYVQQNANAIIDTGFEKLINKNPIMPFINEVIKAAFVIGDSLAGLTTALQLASANIQVTLFGSGKDPSKILGIADENAKKLYGELLIAVADHPQITYLQHARIGQIEGGPGDYEISLLEEGYSITLNVGAILIASDAQPMDFTSEHWVDRSRVKTQAEFAEELDQLQIQQDIVIIFCADPNSAGNCSRLCCAAGIKQALRAKQINPAANVTILFRDLVSNGVNGDFDALIKNALKQGITFFRYSQKLPPVINEKSIDLADPLIGETLKLPYQRAVLAMPFVPDPGLAQIAAMLKLDRDTNGFLVDRRIRLRPGHYMEDGIYILGGVHQPVNLNESLFQAHLVSARAIRFLAQDVVKIEAPVAQIDPQLCTGCGECVQVCHFHALHMQKRQASGLMADSLSVSSVDPRRCTGCGSCVVACPVKAINLPGWEDTTILAQISAALSRQNGAENITGVIQSAQTMIVFACEWSAYAAADIAGARGLNYPADVRIIRMNCGARFDPSHVLWAFLNGAQGVLLGVCPPGDCHYGVGNLQARERMNSLKKQLAEYGIDTQRIRLEFLHADDGQGFIKAIGDFNAELAKIELRTTILNRS